jgi:hypothetical protein
MPAASGDRFEVVWAVEASSAQKSELIVPNNGVVARTRLLPIKLFVNEADIHDANGRLLLPRDAELAFAEADHIVGCVINPIVVSQRTGRTFQALNINTCLMDKDGDGRFDHQFAYNALLLTLGAVGKMRRVSAIPPATYREVRPELVRDSWNLPLVAAHRGGLTILKLCPGRNPTPTVNGWCLSGEIALRHDRLPATFEALGARFTLHAAANGEARISQQSGFAAQPLRIMKARLK